MSKRFKRILMTLLAAALFVPQLWPAPVAEAESSGSTNGNYFLKVETTGGKQWDGVQIATGENGLNLVADTAYTFSYDLYTPDQDVAGIILQTSGRYDWIKNTGALSAASPAWTSYTGDYTYLADSGPQIQFVKAGDGGATDIKNITYYIDNFVVKDASGGVVYSFDFEDQTTGGFTASGTATLTNVNRIDASTPPPPSNVVYDMQEDTGISSAAEDSTFEGTNYLQNSGGTRSIVSYNGGKSIHLSARTGDYQGVDIKLQALGLTAGVEYTFAVHGHVDDSVSVPGDARIVLSNPNAFGTYTDFQWLVNKALTTGNFTIEHKATFSAADIEELANNSYFRIQTNDKAATVPFYVDNITITKTDLIEFEPISITFNDDDKALYEDKFASNGNSSVEWVNETGIGHNGDNYVLKGTHNAGTDYSASANAIRLTLPTPLPAGGIYSVTASVYVPAVGNEGKGTLTGPGIVLNGDYSGANGVSKFPADFGTIDTDTWKELDIMLPVRTSAINTIDFRFVVNEGPNHPDVWYIDDIEIVLIGQENVEIPVWDLDLESLYETYENVFLFGNAISSGQIANTEFANMVKHHYNVITAENEMKPQYISPSEGTYNFTSSDKLVDWALANGIAVHGHTLIWHSQSADWLTKGDGGAPLTRSQAKKNLTDYITEVAGHYKGKFISWDVANEVFADGGSFNGDWKNNLRQSDTPWYMAYANGANEDEGESGADYIYDAFVQTRLIDPDAILYYNDYNENVPTKRDAIADMVEELNSKWEEDERNNEPGRLLIEGIGMQSHFNTSSLNIETVENAIKRFIETGAKITVSELDIPVGDYSNRTTPLTAEEKVEQAQLYAQLMQLYNKYKESIERVTIWGAADPLSWRAAGHPLLFDRLYAAKEAYYAVIDPEAYLDENPLPVPQIIPEANAVAGTAVIDGEQDQVWAKAPIINVNTKPNGQTEQAATAQVRTLWDNQFLYVLVKVADSELNRSSSQAHEQDSVEVFLSESMHRGAEYKTGDGQYRVNYEGDESFRSSSMSDRFESAAKIVDSGYIVEMKIPFRAITPQAGKVVGFDVQINDASASSGRKLTVWSDLKANGYNTTVNWGKLTLMNASTPSQPSNPVVNTPSEPAIEQENGAITLKPTVQMKNGVASASIASNSLKKALEQARENIQGKKQVTIDIPAQAGATSYDVQLPTSNLKDSGTTVLAIKTENGTIELPGNMLAGTDIGNAESVSVRAGKPSTEGLSDEIRQQIGDRPVISLEVLAGDSVVAWNNPSAPVTVSIPYKPTAEELSNPDAIVIWYIDGDGVATAVPNARYDAASGTVIFKTTHFSTYAVAYVNKTFGDLQNAPWASQAIHAMAARDIIKGTGQNNFSPAASITRADFAALLVRALELQGNGSHTNMFSDVPAQAYYYEELAIAKELGIAAGYGDNSFKPGNSISRQDMMVLTTRALEAAGKQNKANGTASLSSFPDASIISGYAKDSATVLVELGIIQGKNGKIAPNDQLNRAEAAIILYRVWNL